MLKFNWILGCFNQRCLHFIFINFVVWDSCSSAPPPPPPPSPHLWTVCLIMLVGSYKASTCKHKTKKFLPYTTLSSSRLPLPASHSPSSHKQKNSHCCHACTICFYFPNPLFACTLPYFLYTILFALCRLGSPLAQRSPPRSRFFPPFHYISIYKV